MRRTSSVREKWKSRRERKDGDLQETRREEEGRRRRTRRRRAPRNRAMELSGKDGRIKWHCSCGRREGPATPLPFLNFLKNRPFECGTAAWTTFIKKILARFYQTQKRNVLVILCCPHPPPTTRLSDNGQQRERKPLPPPLPLSLPLLLPRFLSLIFLPPSVVPIFLRLALVSGGEIISRRIFPTVRMGAAPLFLLVLLFAALLVQNAQGRGDDGDLVTALPGQPQAGFRHYAGYVEVRPAAEKALFYWFFEAEDAPEKKPLLLWLNGGPGCSSVAYGAAQELGPFLVHARGLKRNPYAWNKAANLLFLEAPVGVGFSYTNRSAGLKELGDRVTAEDSHAFLLNWFKKYPRFRSRDFYIAGESYAGHYVPQLANLVHEGNRRAGKDSYINFKGFMIGNAVINDDTDVQGMVDYAWSHAIISDKVYHSFRRACVGVAGNDSSEACDASMKAFMRGYDGIDIYSIYSPVCLSSSHSSRPSMPITAKKPHHVWRTRRSIPRAGYDPCAENYVEKYFNREDVQRALHANVTRLHYPYTSCSNVIEEWKDSAETVLPLIRKLIGAGLRVWIYSGDTDGRVPVTSTRYSINKMELTAKEEWRAWFYRKQVAGWVVEYKEGLTFATLRGAGHQVPAFAPDRSLSLLFHFLAGERLPASHRG